MEKPRTAHRRASYTEYADGDDNRAPRKQGVYGQHLLRDA